MPLRPPKGFIEEDHPRVAPFGHPAPAWLFPYADLMTELVAFFIILYALSAALNKDVQNAAQRIKEMIDEQGLAAEVSIDREGLKFSLEEQGSASYFDSGFADLTPRMQAVLDRIAPTLRELMHKGNPIVIEGHTDNIPIKNEYFWSNWELSTARATSVVEYLIDELEFEPACMAAIGYGEHRPIVPNDSPKNRTRNRRVVFFVKTTTLSGAKACKKAAEDRAAKEAAAKAAAETPAARPRPPGGPVRVVGPRENIQ